MLPSSPIPEPFQKAEIQWEMGVSRRNAEDSTRILWLSPYLPVPISGAGTRVFNLLKVLAKTCKIDLIAGSLRAEERGETFDEVSSLCRTVQVVPRTVRSTRHKRLLQLKSLFSRHPMQYSIFYSAEFQKRLSQAVAECAYDVVILEHSFIGYYALPKGTPTILDQHNVESEILFRSGQRERSAVRRVYNLLEYWKYHSDERRICRNAGLLLATSRRDCETMLSWGDVPRCVVIPNGVDSTYFSPMENGEDSPKRVTVLFTGTMDYSPNTEAMLYFVGQIWPLIREKVPEASLQIVGRSPPPAIVKLDAFADVEVTGSVPDVRPYLAASQVVVAPLRIGGGTRLKILEALAMARAVVSTSLGCEGLELQNGQHLLVADDPVDFASSVASLLRDPARREMIGAEGRHLVEGLYDWQALGTRMEEVLRDFVQGQASTS